MRIYACIIKLHFVLCTKKEQVKHMTTKRKDKDTYMKYLAIIDTIMQNSDENHPMTISDIQEKLYEKNLEFNADYRLIIKYVDIYNEYHNEDIIIHEKHGRNQYFYFTDRSLDTMEAKAIIDLVYSSDFFTKTTKENYKKRIQKMFSSHYKNYFNKLIDIHISKNENSQVFYKELEKITQAIDQHKMIRFIYKKPSLQKDIEYKIQELAPIDTMFSNNTYYLLCQGNRELNSCLSYRLDYVQNVEIVEDSRVYFSNDQLYHFKEKIKNITYMYGEGEMHTIELEFDGSVYTNIIDKFGHSIDIVEVADNLYRTKVRHVINSTFYSWIIGFGGKIQIVGNEDQVHAFRKFLQSNFINN